MRRENIRSILKEYVENSVETDNSGLESLFNDCVKKIYGAYQKLHGHTPDIPDVKLEFNDNFKDGKIGAFVHPEYEGDNGIMMIKTKALDNGGAEYVKHIITHELIHAVLGHKNHEHDEHFHRLSDLLGLPEEYRD
jgi:hypothetical protein